MVIFSTEYIARVQYVCIYGISKQILAQSSPFPLACMISAKTALSWERDGEDRTQGWSEMANSDPALSEVRQLPDESKLQPNISGPGIRSWSLVMSEDRWVSLKVSNKEM